MTDKKPELSDAMKKKLEPKKFTKNPILGTKFTIAISSAKGGSWKIYLCNESCFSFKTNWMQSWFTRCRYLWSFIPKMFDINEKPKSDGQKLEPIVQSMIFNVCPLVF